MTTARSETSLPPWTVEELPAARPIRRKDWAALIGPGIVMAGIQIGGGEWLLGPEITVRYGGGLMWIATIAIVLQVFYNLECGRYALYCGEPVTSGFMRLRPGPRFWIGVVMLLNLSALIPALSTNGAAAIAAVALGRPPGEGDRAMVTTIAYICQLLIVLPVLVGGRVYDMLQAVMTAKVAIVLGFCLFVGVFFVGADQWADVMSGFLKFGNVPVMTDGKEGVANVFQTLWTDGSLPTISLANIAVLGAFAGYAGGGGLSNSTYSNYVRDKGWGMGSRVGAIASAVGGRRISLSHVGKVFKVTDENLTKWKYWWKYIFIDQVFVWAPGCFMGMALPALLSMKFAPFSPLYEQTKTLEWAQAVITADGFRHAPALPSAIAHGMWLLTLFVGMAVLFPSQMSIVEDVSRRWTDVIWSGNRKVRETMRESQVKFIYYGILSVYVAWTFVAAYIFNRYGTPKLMTLVIANLNNLAIGVTAFVLLKVNLTLLPVELRPGRVQRLGMIGCGVFYLGMAGLVFWTKQLPMISSMLGFGGAP